MELKKREETMQRMTKKTKTAKMKYEKKEE
jgi:hypothetical protein